MNEVRSQTVRRKGLRGWRSGKVARRVNRDLRKVDIPVVRAMLGNCTDAALLQLKFLGTEFFLDVCTDEEYNPEEAR